MCGILGVVALTGRAPSLDDGAVVRMRDRMTRRGPDDAGLWRHENVVFAHRRLSVIDTSSAGRQPMVTADGRFVIVYNGELYNDAELRRELLKRGAPAGGFRTACDTETVLHAFATWGDEAFSMLRGMFAIGVYDTRQKLLTLARDPLGVKPLYLWADEAEIVFASEPGAILAHPRVGASPNLEMVSAYLTTIRTVLGNDTLFQGIHALAPGQMAQCHVGGRSPTARMLDYWRGPAAGTDDVSDDGAAEAVRGVVTESVLAHLRSDVPTCALLSGGIDSTITATIARREMADLRTYCAGAEGEAPENGDDLAFARLAAGAISTRHSEAIVTREMFAERWPWMVREIGMPLSTPNEVAIHAVAARLREDGCIVTISGEGADELFAGYEPVMMAAAEFEGRAQRAPARGRFQLESNAWAPTSVKAAILSEGVWGALEGDAWLIGRYEREFERCVEEVGAEADALDAHLRFHRRINLTGLLQRLDTATMLASVEGRTPFADARVAEMAEALPMRAKFRAAEGGAGGSGGGGAVTATRAGTKIALRAAFAGDVPAEIVRRPKASFPLPFQGWVADQGEWFRKSGFARAIFSEAAIETVASDPNRHWRLAWPMMNVAMWGDAWWGGEMANSK